MRNITEDQCNSTEEVCGLFRGIFADIEQMEAKIVQLSTKQESTDIEVKRVDADLSKVISVFADKAKKKGKKKMKSKGSASMRVIAILMVLAAIVSVCYAAYVPGDISYDIASNPETLAIYLRDVTNNMRSNTYVFTPRAAAPALPVEGMVYYNSGTDNWIGYTDPGGWQNFDVAGGLSLNSAYDFGGAGNGRTILANDGSVVISNADADAAPLLELTFTGGAVGSHGLIVTTDGTGSAIEIENTGTGYDFEGTANFTIDKVGALIAASGDFTGAAGITLQNDETITNPDGKITFTTNGGHANTLIFDLQHAATGIELESGDVVTLDFGTVDNLAGVETITFDDAATVAISMTGTGTNDLLITQLGATTQSLILNSDGNVVDAITISTLGGIDADTVLSIVLTSAEDQPDAIVIESTAGGIDILASNAGVGDDIDIIATTSSVNITSTEDAASAITLTTNGGVSETIVVTNTQGTGADAITIVGTAGGIAVDAVDDIIITVASTAAADDLALVQTGAVNASITLAAAGTGVDAIDLNASAGGIDIDSALAMTIDNAAGDISIISAAGSVVISASEDAVDAINIDSTAGGIDIDAAGEAGQDIIITNTGGSIALVSTESAVNSIVLQSTLGGIDIQCDAATSEDIDILNTGGSINLVATENDAASIVLQSTLGGIDIQCDAAGGEDIDITNTGGSIDIYATENAPDSIVIQSTLGGIDIRADASGAEDIDISNTGGNVHIVSDADATDAFNLDVTGTDGGVDIDTTDGPITLTTAGAANGDILIDASDKITIISSDVQAAGILLQVDGGAAETIHINSTAGTTAAAINIDADVGGITILADGAVAGDILIDAEDNITITSADQDAGGIDIGVPAGGHANSTIHIHNETGTGAVAIGLQADVGAISILSNGAAAGDILIDAEDRITLTTDDEDAGAITITSAAGGAAASTIIITNTAGTAVSLAAAESAAIQLYADAGGIGLNSGLNGANAIRIEADGGANEIIMIHANQGTGVAASGEVDSSVQLMSDDGGIGLYTTANLANAIRIEANGGGNETININSVQGTGSGSILLNSVLGGIDITANAAGKDIDINSVLGSINLLAEETGAAQAMSIVADGDATTAIWIQSITGTSVTEDTCALEIRATVGGIAIQSDANLDDCVVIRADGGTTSEITITNDQGNTSDSIEIVSVAGGVTIAGGADDSITMTTGAAGGAAGNVVFTNGQTRKEVLDGLGQVVPDGVSPPATIGALGTNGTALLWAWEFEADGGADEFVFLNWRVPDGYITDSARLNVIWSYDTAEGDGDTVDFDFTVQATAPGAAATGGEVWEVGGTAGAVVVETLTSGSTTEDTLIITQINIDGTGEVIAIDDLVTIMFWVDASECEFAAGVSVDVHTFEIEWESTE